MLEKMFTTKMSMDKKSLQQRFSKIRSKNSKKSKLIAVIISFLIIAIIAASAIYVAVKKSNDNVYAMSNEELLAFTSRFVDTVIPELDYVDEEMIVFHYEDGLIVTNRETKEVIHKINLNKLNIAKHANIQSKDDVVLRVNIDTNGDFAYLLSVGPEEKTEKFDEYAVNLNTGEVKVKKMPSNTDIVKYPAVSLPGDKYPKGRYSQNCIMRNGNMYLLYLGGSTMGELQLASAEDTLEFEYVFANKYVNDNSKEWRIIHDSLANGEEIFTNSGMFWYVDADVVKQIVDKLNTIMQIPSQKVENGYYKVITYATELNGNVAERIYIINTDNMELIFTERLDLTGYAGLKEYYSELIELLSKNKRDISEKEFNLYDENNKKIIPVANWYNVAEKCFAVIHTEGTIPQEITAYYTDSGTDMEQYKKVVGKTTPTSHINEIELNLDSDLHGHLWFVFDLGTHEVRSASYSIASKNDTLSSMLNVDNTFKMSDLNDMMDIMLVIGSDIYSPVDNEAMKKIEKTLSNAEPIGFGKPGCPFKATLIIFNKDGYRSKVELATDSCAAFGYEKTYYDYGDDNVELYSLFGIDSRKLSDLT